MPHEVALYEDGDSYIVASWLGFPVNHEIVVAGTNVASSVYLASLPRWLRQLLEALADSKLLTLVILSPSKGRPTTETYMQLFLPDPEKGETPKMPLLRLVAKAQELAGLEARAQQSDDHETFRAHWSNVIDELSQR